MPPVAEEPPPLGDYAGDLRRSDELHCVDVAVLMTTARWYIRGRVNTTGMQGGKGALVELMYRRSAVGYNIHPEVFPYTGCLANTVMPSRRHVLT